jgi:hypothetical protein
MTSKFDEEFSHIMDELSIIDEGKYAKWVDQRGRLIYPKLLSMKEMKKVLPRKLGFFQKGGDIYSLPLIPTRGKIQKEFKKYYRRGFTVNPNFK